MNNHDPIADLCAWLRAKYARHGEIEDRDAADALERQANEIADLNRAWKAMLDRAERAEAERDDWKRLAENWTACADAAQQPPEFYEKYNEGTMRAMQALLTRERTEGAALRTERDALRECVKAADKLRYNYFMGDGKLYDAARAKVKP